MRRKWLYAHATISSQQPDRPLSPRPDCRSTHCRSFPRLRWGGRFFAHYLRLVGGVSAWIYLILAGLIIGFTATYFTFKFLPFRLYTQPLLIDELLASIGFALYRFLVPVLATILIAARCGAAVAADVGVKQYGGQVDALRTLGVKPKAYLLVPIVLAFIVATPMLEWLAYSSARLISLATFHATHPAIGPYFWEQHFYRNLDDCRPQLAAGVGLGAAKEYCLRCRDSGNRLLSRYRVKALRE